MRHGLFWSSRDLESSTSKFDLTSGHRNDLSRPCCISVHGSRQGKQIGTFTHVSISFLSKVMGKNVFWPDDVTMCHNDVHFLSITFDRKEIDTWGRCQIVCLVETHWLICNMIYLGRFRDLTWGQISKLTFRGHVMIKIGHVAYVSMRLDEKDSVIPFPRLKAHFLELLCKKTCNFPMTSSCDLRWPFEGSLTPKWHSPSLDYCSEPHRQQIVINHISISQPSPEILTESVRRATIYGVM